jgi:hypothetical protein
MAVLEALHGNANIMLAYFHHRTPGGLSFVKGWASESGISACHLGKGHVKFL